MTRNNYMSRRKFIAAASAGTVLALAGCTAGEKAPPPRKSQVIEGVEVNDGALTYNFSSKTWVKSRYKNKTDGDDDSNSLAPVGKASAKGKGGVGGRGAGGRGTGGYSSAPRTSNGFAWFLAGSYVDDWYENHKKQVEKHPVEVSEVGIAYVGDEEYFEDNKPGLGPVPWDEGTDKPKSFTPTIDKPGWYRLGFHLVHAKNDHDFKWVCYDLKFSYDGDSYDLEQKWKVSPRI